MGAAGNGQSLCHQMIMGAGKTTVVGPVLALLLGDGVSLITQVRHCLLPWASAAFAAEALPFLAVLLRSCRISCWTSPAG